MTDELVSIVVVTYNSSLFIEETLDSIFNQTYRNIELIISDDCSQDNTVAICNHWIAQKADRFTNIKLITSPINTGVSANENRGDQAALGRWVKGLAGDDLLLPEAISQYVAFMEQNPSAAFVFGKPIFFCQDRDGNEEILADPTTYHFFNLSHKNQYKSLLLGPCYLPACTFFYDRSVYNHLKITNDESIPMVEDWPKWIKISKKAVSFYLLDAITVKYRIHPNSLTTGAKKRNSPLVMSTMLMFVKYQFCYNFLYHPRLSCIKYIICKQQITHKKVWYSMEKIAKRLDSIVYLRNREKSMYDWDLISKALGK